MRCSTASLQFQPLNISNIIPRSIFTLSNLLLHKFHHSPSQSQRSKVRPLSVAVSKNECDDEFLPWLEKKAGMPISSLLSIGISPFGRSLFACKSIQAGDCLLKVPFIVQISPDNVLPEIKSLLSDASIGTVAKLAVVVLVEQKKGQNSEWAPYISRLPRHGELHSTMFWSEKELKMIQQSSLYQETANQKAQIRKDYLAIKPVFDSFPEIFEDVRFEKFRHAYGLVVSRAWESTKGQSLIPFADFLNHDGMSDSLLSDEKEQCSEVIADRDYAPGEEIFIRYGRFSNSTLLLHFGFTLPCNIYDQVCIRVDVPCDDHLRALKLNILQKHCLPMTKDASFDSSSGTFVLKEVKSAKGKGSGIPQSLRAFARVLCCTSYQDLNDLVVEAHQHDGRLARRPLVRNLEIRAHEFLLSHIEDLITKYNVSIELLPVQASNGSKFAIRRQMAEDLLTGELRVLKSASIWLNNYCHSYLQQGKTSLNA